MTLSIKNGRSIFLIRLDLMLSVSWKELDQLNLSIKHWIKLILYENDLELLKL